MGKNVLIIFLLIHSLLLHTKFSFSQQKYLKLNISECGVGPLSFSTIIIRKPKDGKIYAQSAADSNGRFEFISDFENEKQVELVVRFSGYKEKIIKTSLDSMKGNVLNICLNKDFKPLDEVVVSRKLPMVSKQDTLIFNANSYRKIETIRLEDLLKNIPGFSINNGIISFNGQIVENLLLDGVDIAGARYQILSKNLNAILIDKIKIIPDYSENRILGSIKHSGTTAVNIELSQDFKNKINKSIDIGLADFKKYHFDINVLQSRSDFKWFSNASINSVSNIGEEQDLYQTDIVQLKNNYTHENYYLSALPLPVIPLASEYLKNRTDIGSGLLLAGKINSKLKHSCQFKWYQNNGMNYFKDNYKYDLGNVIELVGLNKILLNSIKNNFSSNYKLIYDDGKKNNLIFYLNFEKRKKIERSSDLFTGYLNGLFSDTIKNNELTYSIRLEYSKPIAGKRILSTSVHFAKSNINESLFSDNSLYSQLRYLKVNWNSWNQIAIREIENFKSDLKIYKKTGKAIKTYGIKIDLTKNVVFAGMNDIMKFQFHNNVKFKDYNLASFFRFEKKLKLNYTYSWDIHAGISDRVYDHFSVPKLVYESTLQFTKKISSQQNIKLKIYSDRTLPDPFYSHPDSLFIGQGVIMNGLTYLKPVKVSQISFGINGLDIYKQRSWSLYSYFNNRIGDYVNSTSLISGLLIWDKLPINGHSLSINGKGEIFIPFLKLKTFGSFVWAYTKTDMVVNRLRGESIRSNKNIELALISGFKFPINFEMKINHEILKARWNEIKFGQFNQDERLFSLRLKPSDKIFISFTFYDRKGQGYSFFKGLEMFALISVSKKMKVSVKGHNLLNSQYYRNISNNGLSLSTTEISLVGRYVLFNMDIVL